MATGSLIPVKQFLKFCGLPKVANGEYCDGRDYFANCDANVEKDTAGYYLRVDSESAWNPNMTALEYMLKAKYNGTVKMVYRVKNLAAKFISIRISLAFILPIVM